MKQKPKPVMKVPTIKKQKLQLMSNLIINPKLKNIQPILRHKLPVSVPTLSPNFSIIQLEGNNTNGYMIEKHMVTILTSSSETPYRFLVPGPIAENACVATELQNPASINRTKFTYLYLDAFTYLYSIDNIIRSIIYLSYTISSQQIKHFLTLQRQQNNHQFLSYFVYNVGIMSIHIYSYLSKWVMNKIIYFGLFFMLLSGVLTTVNKCGLEGAEEEFAQKIKAILDSHLVQGQKWGMKYHFYRPGLQKYGPYQWLWDSAFHMIAWSRINVTNSLMDIRTMLQKQNNRTFEIPQMIFWGHQGIKDKILNQLMLSDPTVTDISQMPMLAFSLQRIYEQTKDIEILKQIVPKLVEYYQWWARMRQPDRDGLIVIIHPWQSGLDASPMYDEALGVKNPQPKLKELYPQFQKLQLQYKFKYKWDQKKIIAPKPRPIKHIWPDYFVVKQVGVNAVYTASWKILANLAKEMGNEPLTNYCLKQYHYFVQGIQRLFDQEKGRYVSKYRSGKQFKTARADTIQSLFPILIPEIKPEHKKAIIDALRDEKKYKSSFPIPTVSRSDPAFNPIFTIDLMWRGPSWAAPNYFILEGLRRQNEIQLYKQIGQKWANTALTKGIWEMWNPLTGQGYGVKDLGMGTSVLDVMCKLKKL